MAFMCRTCNGELTKRERACPSCGRRIISPAILLYGSLLYPIVVMTIFVGTIVLDLGLEALATDGVITVLLGLALAYVRRHTPIASNARSR